MFNIINLKIVHSVKYIAENWCESTVSLKKLQNMLTVILHTNFRQPN